MSAIAEASAVKNEPPCVTYRGGKNLQLHAKFQAAVSKSTEQGLGI